MSETCQACSGFIEKGADGVWRHLARWEPCISARPRTRTATLISLEQQRALAEYLSLRIERNEWKYWVVGGVVAFYLALLSRGDWRIFAVGLVMGAITTASIIATVERAHALLRRETTLIRVGNDEYARDNRSYGLTTMHDGHVKVSGSKVRFIFRGKSGIEHDLTPIDPNEALLFL